MKRISCTVIVLALLSVMSGTDCYGDDHTDAQMVEMDAFASSCCDSACDSIGCGCCTPDRYLSVFGGWNFLHAYDTFAMPAAGQAWGSFNDGWAIGGALGRRVCDPLRLELEYAFRDNTADLWRAAAVGQWFGRTQLHTLMANSQIDLPAVCGLRPYVGAGIGLAYAEGTMTTANGLTTVRIDDEAFAYQFMAGLSRQINCNVDVFAEYRFLEARGVHTETTNPVWFEEEEGHFENESVLLGLRFYY